MLAVAAGRRANTVTIPVCYGVDLGPDLQDVAQHAGLAKSS
jgi:allophanate hydrolase subunit 1